MSVAREVEAAVKPLLRGWSHAVGGVLALAGTAVLIYLARGDTPKLLTFLAYGASMVALLGVSAVYHVVDWPPRVRAALRRVDHADIFVFIAGSYTPIAFNVLSGWWRLGILVLVWTLAAAGVASVAPAVRLPRWALAGLYVAMGWMGVLVVPQIARALGWSAIVLIVAAGIAYSLGAAAYALKRPRLWPRVFGYHEVFHAMVLVASLAFFVLMAFYVAPYPRS